MNKDVKVLEINIPDDKEKEKIYEKLKKTIELFYKTYKEEVKEWEKK